MNSNILESKNSLAHWLFLIVLVSSGPCMALMFTALGPVLPAIAEHFGNRGIDGSLVAQLVMTMPGIGMVVGGWLTGWIGDKLGPRRLLYLMLVLYGGAGVLGAYVDRIDVLLLSRLIVGIAACGVGTATLVLIGQRYHGVARAKILGYQGGAGAFFGVASLLVAGRVAESSDWRAPFSLYLFSFLILIAAMISLRQAGESEHEAPDLEALAEVSPSSWHTIRHLWLLYGMIIVVMIAHFTNAVQIAFLLAKDGVASPVTQSLVLSASAVANASSSWAYGWVRSVIGAKWTFRTGLFLMAVGYIFISCTSGAPFTAVGSAIAGVGSGVLLPHLLYLLLDHAPEKMRARAGGLFYSAVYLGDFLNPVVVAPIRYIVGIHGVFLVMGILVALGLIWEFFLFSKPKTGIGPYPNG